MFTFALKKECYVQIDNVNFFINTAFIFLNG